MEGGGGEEEEEGGGGGSFCPQLSRASNPLGEGTSLCRSEGDVGPTDSNLPRSNGHLLFSLRRINSRSSGALWFSSLYNNTNYK